ncbi:MAG: hypothetical protein UU98_C0018G0023 [Parcubacteria group bacterium GW2011_GWD2_42_14]|nr:MAG: hypothetical protein UU98_C0018G0023 [Parcubacteria group bacterium GW2011_GWD2_42_14]
MDSVPSCQIRLFVFMVLTHTANFFVALHKILLIVLFIRFVVILLGRLELHPSA